jgi:hypothetical protein
MKFHTTAAHAAAMCMLSAFFQPAAAQGIREAISGATPLANARLRYETVSQDNRAQDAHSVTFRLRAGLETAPLYDTKLGIEFEWVESLNGQYNSTTNGRTQFPVVADPQDTELNRLYLTNTSIDSTTLTVGRQRIVYDDARFIGDVIWRQNQQTYDALAITNQGAGNLTLNAAYVTRVNRIFGPDSVMSPWDTQSVFLNAAYKTPIGSLTAFAYLLDIDDALVLSTQTYGARFTGAQNLQDVTFKYAVSFASQSDYQDNPVAYNAQYFAAELTAATAGFSATAGYEALSSDAGVRGFSTPLATAHKFQGFADVFLATPDTGVRDLYFKAGYKTKEVGPFSAIGGHIAYHQFDADFGGATYGDELDFVVSAKWEAFLFLVKYGSYNARDFAVDTRRLTFDINFAY